MVTIPEISDHSHLPLLPWTRDKVDRSGSKGQRESTTHLVAVEKAARRGLKQDVPNPTLRQRDSTLHSPTECRQSIPILLSEDQRTRGHSRHDPVVSEISSQTRSEDCFTSHIGVSQSNPSNSVGNHHKEIPHSWESWDDWLSCLEARYG